MFNFDYTDVLLDVDSTLVDEIYYNANDKSMLVDLDDTVYHYTDVPVEVFEAFKASSSKGRFYGRKIKSSYGPGTKVGHYTEVEAREVDKVKAPVLASVGAAPLPNWERPRDASGRFQSSGLRVKTPEPVAPVTGLYTTLRTVDSTPGVENVAGQTRTHVIAFTLKGKDRVKYHTVQANSVDEAVSLLSDAAEALDATFTVKEVTVKFD